jgi:hypothetical protein
MAPKNSSTLSDSQANPDFEKALQIGRPPNIVKLFPNSKALIVSGKFIDMAMLAKGNAITMAANGRSSFVIRGALRAAQRANAALIIEIAKSKLLEHRQNSRCRLQRAGHNDSCGHPCRSLRFKE